MFFEYAPFTSYLLGNNILTTIRFPPGVSIADYNWLSECLEISPWVHHYTNVCRMLWRYVVWRIKCSVLQKNHCSQIF